jgi:predicted Fe-Mo cluster-binding NifX family protein
MRIVLPICRDRISPVFDVSRRFLIVNVNRGSEVTREEVLIGNRNPITKAKRIVELKANVLICGAISWPLEAVLVSASMHVIRSE